MLPQRKEKGSENGEKSVSKKPFNEAFLKSDEEIVIFFTRLMFIPSGLRRFQLYYETLFR